MNSISIIIPCYNEENNLKKGVLDEVFDFLKTQKFQWEVIICNDESTDKSLKLIKDFASKHKGFRVLDLPHGGKPSAVWGGIQEAKYPIVLFTDMDQSTPLKEMNKLLPFFNKRYDVVIGSRGVSREGNTLFRKIGGAVFLSLRRAVLLHNIIDTQCGFKMFKTEVAKDLFPNLQFFKDKSDKKGWRVSAFDVELLFMAQKWGYKIKEVEVDWQNEDISDTKGDNGTRYRKESIQMINEIKRVLINNFKGIYDKK
ncbi:MAG: glycosyltransferase [Candidatus Shapirobacteria bacterium]|nr:glycosyltransferase [Candidatus Shapirobacteria bacterium]MDD3002448.1 glycosyltransferase [Candidatus Shapirobacteria bacterium]MDD4383363.1 glycosyltransferase [Candidatus Shapirobacteria bacterium]